ncbi:9090_t:CDS:2 [Acaulospora colombiana]|uniref:9090_t:CDS:1 n=1 Tax=Acaulospora colombiana TaxID=27376 RepID=A0ACA9LP56_9GLOM|nr:9090_t:CDS:2 [Acaulospora colombiana]
MALLESVCPELNLVARGKVRDLYRVDDDSLLFVATDRISAFDVIMKNMPAIVQKYKDQLEHRCLLVKNLKVFPVEAIVRGYITGSAWSEYKRKGSVCDIPLPEGLLESQSFDKVMYTPSTKAEIGQHDENIHPSKVPEIVGEKCAQDIAELSVKLYSKARDYAIEKGIIIADTKFEFGVDSGGRLHLVDEVLTPDSSRFWLSDNHEVGKSQER